MAATFGLSDKGFRGKDLLTIKDELEAKLRAEVDPTLRFGPDSIAGLITGIVGHQASQVWEALSGLYHSLQPETATGRALDALCSLTGTYRKNATFSKAIAVMTLDGKAKVPKDSRIQSLSGHFFRVTKEVNNTATTKMDLEADLIAEEVGPIIAHPKTEAKIMTPASGWSKAVFKNTYETGYLDESDTELRLRRITDLKAIGSSTVDAIRSRLQQLPHVEAVHIKESSRSFETIIKGGKDKDIATTIWQCKPLGVETAGAIEFTVKDSLEAQRKIRFSRPIEIPLTLHANIKVRRQLNADELNALKSALVDCGKQHFALGAEVYASRFFKSFLEKDLVLDVITLQLRDRASSKAAPTEIKPEQIASLSFNDIYIEQIVESAS
jgi:uncharacterized phage protein gp47/JayE